MNRKQLSQKAARDSFAGAADVAGLAEMKKRHFEP
jgi:hypothetical protein